MWGFKENFSIPDDVDMRITMGSESIVQPIDNELDTKRLFVRGGPLFLEAFSFGMCLPFIDFVNRLLEHLNRVPGNLSLLNSVLPYYGSQKVMVGNGTLLPISHVGTPSLTFNHHVFHRNHVLVVPQLKKNLIYIQRLCYDNACLVQLSSSSFTLKDPKTMTSIAQCSSHGSLYPLISSNPACLSVSLSSSARSRVRRVISVQQCQSSPQVMPSPLVCLSSPMRLLLSVAPRLSHPGYEVLQTLV
ncbi:hypothetical protein LIER_12595 [Lithospermum erythrorhizon]|uniref:Uncharacterized protein n=1 Tax=Lithospermum erythrorhizon TaxID=34254 RepID=A0AAV3PSC3_LITER